MSSKPLDGALKASFQFAASGFRSRRQLTIHKLSREVHGRQVAIGRHLTMLLAIEAPPAGNPMPPMGVDHTIARHLPQPEMKRQFRRCEIFL